MPRIPALTVVAFVLLAIVTGACGSGAPGTATGAPTGGGPTTGAAPTSGGAPTSAPVHPGTGGLDACALITLQEAVAATATEITAANPTSAPDTSTCLYVNETGSPVLSSALQLGTAGIAPYLDDPANEQVPGIGDRAVIYQAPGGLPTGRTIYVQRGDRAFVLNVHVEELDDAQARTILTDLATAAVGRM